MAILVLSALPSRARALELLSVVTGDRDEHSSGLPSLVAGRTYCYQPLIRISSEQLLSSL